METLEVNVLTDSKTAIERIADKIFAVMPEDNIWAVVFDDQDNYFSSNQDNIIKHFTGNNFLADIRQRLDDGGGLTITNFKGLSVIASDLTGNWLGNAYLVLVFEKLFPEDIVKNIELIEILINQCQATASEIMAVDKYSHLPISSN
jgi:hypothetical protein